MSHARWVELVRNKGYKRCNHPVNVVLQGQDLYIDKAIMSDKTIELEPESAGVAPIKPVSRFTRWYRSPLFNVIVVGLISFTQPGIWNALNSTSSFFNLVTRN